MEFVNSNIVFARCKHSVFIGPSHWLMSAWRGEYLGWETAISRANFGDSVYWRHRI